MTTAKARPRKSSAPKTFPNGEKINPFDTLREIFSDEETVDVRSGVRVRVRKLSNRAMAHLQNKFLVLPKENEEGDAILDDPDFQEKAAEARLKRQTYLIERGVSQLEVKTGDGDWEGTPFTIPGETFEDRNAALHDDWPEHLVTRLADAIEQLTTDGELRMANFSGGVG
jgi:hypothetical protein